MVRPPGHGETGSSKGPQQQKSMSSLGGAIHVDVDIAGGAYSHIVPCRVGCGVQTVVVGTRLTTASVHTSGELVHAVVGTERVGIGAEVVLP